MEYKNSMKQNSKTWLNVLNKESTLDREQCQESTNDFSTCVKDQLFIKTF